MHEKKHKHKHEELLSFIPKYVKRQQIELVELSFLLFSVNFNKQDKLANND